eukprot:TRINITY_DN6804_c0_g1_i2.p1 TRINITY_DN6804_c0_g1~~TRINITY_DN6804_c0_g1_i2.p1  ORF type:complete len:190 (+),score=62.08 TRINITY_DN6804_c0_g1_i2:53-622(+)
MASRGGQMVAGTDGQDFQHRERVAGQYSVSATNKARMKGLVVVHLLLGVVHLVRLLPSILPLLGISAQLPLPTLPIPSPIEYAWLASLPFALLALNACKRSKSGPLQVFQLVLLVACISTSLITLFILSPDTIEFLLSGSFKGQATVGDYPYPALWSAFLLLCVVVHAAEIVVTRTLVQAWAPRHGKRQ